jgi:hypothetical protein
MASVCVIVALNELKNYDPCIFPINKRMQKKQVKLQVQVQKLGILWGCKPKECSP